MPVELLSTRERERLSGFPGEIPREDLAAYFTLTGADLDLIVELRGEHNRLGFVPASLGARPAARPDRGGLSEDAPREDRAPGPYRRRAHGGRRPRACSPRLAPPSRPASHARRTADPRRPSRAGGPRRGNGSSRARNASRQRDALGLAAPARDHELTCLASRRAREACVAPGAERAGIESAIAQGVRRAGRLPGDRSSSRRVEKEGGDLDVVARRRLEDPIGRLEGTSRNP